MKHYEKNTEQEMNITRRNEIEDIIVANILQFCIFKKIYSFLLKGGYTKRKDGVEDLMSNDSLHKWLQQL